MNDNLIPIQSKEEAREKGRLGGIASGEARRKKKLIKEQLELLLSLPLKDENAKRKLEQIGIDTDNLDNQMAMIISIWNKALKGDIQAFNSIRDSVGEKPTDRQEVDNTVNFKNSPVNELIESIEKIKNGNQ